MPVPALLLPPGVPGVSGTMPPPPCAYSDRPSDYTLHVPIGFGASSTVYLSSYHPASSTSTGTSTSTSTSTIATSSSSSSSSGASSAPAPLDCAIKVINLDTLPPSSLTLLTRETRLMSLSKHPNVLRVRGSWVQGARLYIAMRLMRKGSVADLLAYAHQGGMPEEVCRCILRQALEGLNYLHTNGFIHRDVKAANLLIDDDGTVLLGDLGVAVSVLDDVVPSLPGIRPGPGPGEGSGSGTGAEGGKHLGRRRSFVGTPSWMAPEVVRRLDYDSAADIWSFGILCLEITRGRAPYSREPPSKILLHTLSSPPPTLDLTGGVHPYSQSFADIVSSCLQKDPSSRPTAAQLLERPFFRNAKKKGYLVSSVLQGLPPLERRMERRRRESWHDPATGSSWDFESTLLRTPTIAHSPSRLGPHQQQHSLPLAPRSPPQARSPSLARPPPGPGPGYSTRRAHSFSELEEGEPKSADRASWNFTASPERGSASLEQGKPTSRSGREGMWDPASRTALSGKTDGEEEEDELWEPEPHPSATPSRAPGPPAASASPPAFPGEKTPKVYPTQPGERLPHIDALTAEQEEHDVPTPLGGSRRPSMNGRAPSVPAAVHEKERERARGFLGSFRRRLSSGQGREREKGLVGGLLKMGKRNVT